jgi:hypothetical protein
MGDDRRKIFTLCTLWQHQVSLGVESQSQLWRLSDQIHVGDNNAALSLVQLKHIWEPELIGKA